MKFTRIRTTATTRRMCINPPMAALETNPSAQRIIRKMAIFRSIVFLSVEVMLERRRVMRHGV
jgi:hypothetical protein